MNLVANTLVKNEEKYLWYSVMSIIDHVDQIKLWDTGSTDNTLKIIEEIRKRYPSKVETKFFNNVSAEEFSELRQQMLNETNSKWILVLDGDEVWWDDAIKEIKDLITNSNNLESIVTRHYNLVGDIYHFQEEDASLYNINNKKGHYNLKLVSKNIPGLHVKNPYGSEGFYDGKNIPIQTRDSNKRYFVEKKCYLHFTHLRRSSVDGLVMQRSRKFKPEIGYEFPLDFYYPEILFKNRPKVVPSPWVKLSGKSKINAYLQTPLRKAKRRIILK